MGQYLQLSESEISLFWNVLYNRIEKVRELLDPLNTEHLINIRNCVDRYGRTPLFGAVMACNTEMCKILLDHGVDINHKDRDGCTALHRIITDNIYHVDEAMFMNTRTSTWTIRRSYSRFSRYDKLSPIYILLAYNADISIQDNNGNTPLHLICYEHDKGLCRTKVTKVVRWFIEKGIDVTLRNNVNVAVVDIVKSRRLLREIREEIYEVHRMQCRQACYSFTIKKWTTTNHDNNLLASNNKKKKSRKRKNATHTSSWCQLEAYENFYLHNQEKLH